MADKKLNAVSTASDGAYIYAEDASGNQIKISKADLASVVAGIMGFDSNYLVKATTVMGSSFNIDNTKPACGNYRYWGDGSGVPTGTFPFTISTNTSFLLFVRTATNGMCVQTLYTGSVTSGSLNHKYERVFAGRWSAWNDLGSFTY